MCGHYGGNPYKWDLKGNANGPHITRYFLAKGWIFPWETVLDAACATGYGSKLMALQAKKVIGYEIDEGCIEVANQNKPENCEFKVMDLNTCELPDVDVAVTIETIEHTTPEGMLHFTEQLRKHVRRCIIVTVPLGGTSFEYKDWPPSPHTEKNDFFKEEDIINIMAPEGSGWRGFNWFKFGYSHFGIYARNEEDIIVPEEWRKKAGL